MQFEWDEAKAGTNRAKHGVDFAWAVLVFADPYRVTFDDNRCDYGEPRQNTIGAVGGAIILCVTHTNRHGALRLISARRASRHERKFYHGQTS